MRCRAKKQHSQVLHTFCLSKRFWGGVDRARVDGWHVCTRVSTPAQFATLYALPARGCAVNYLHLGPGGVRIECFDMGYRIQVGLLPLVNVKRIMGFRDGNNPRKT